MAQVRPPTGAWRQTNVTWTKPPAELGLKERDAESKILYFSPDHKFVVLYALVMQRPGHEEISHGDGCVAYLGTWTASGGSVHVEYRLVSKTIRMRGEALPGPVRSGDIRVRGSGLYFGKDRFVRDRRLDGSLKAIVHDESVHPGMSCENP